MGAGRGVVDLAEEVDVQLDPRRVLQAGNRLCFRGRQDHTGSGADLVPVGDQDGDGGRDGLGPVLVDPGGEFRGEGVFDEGGHRTGARVNRCPATP